MLLVTFLYVRCLRVGLGGLGRSTDEDEHQQRQAKEMVAGALHMGGISSFYR
jgi:hypothetical protein